MVPEALIDDITRQGDRSVWKEAEGALMPPYASMSHRSGWYVIDHEPKTLFAMSIRGQNLSSIPPIAG